MPINNKYEASGLEYSIDPSVNVKNLVKQFTDGRLIFNGRYVRADISLVNRSNNTFLIYRAKLDDKYTVPLSKDFDIYIHGLRVPFDIYTVAQVGQNVVITFKPDELDFDTFCADDIVVFGKFEKVNIDEVTVYLKTQENLYLLTEDDKLLIITSEDIYIEPIDYLTTENDYYLLAENNKLLII
jgi:hypothetical protein